MNNAGLAMGFLNAWAIGVGVLALAAPLAVHLLTRPKPVAFRLSTMGLLAEVIQQRRARSRIRDWLILLLRVLAVALLALAVARPILESGSAVPITADGNAARVILLDVSQSMAAGSGGASSIMQARTATLEFLDAMPGVQACVIFVGAQPRSVFDQLSPNLASLRQAVDSARVRPERADVRAAMQLAGRMLTSVGDRQRELVIVSDFQRTNWGTLFLDEIPAETEIQLHAVRPAVMDNVAITSVQFSAQPIAGQATTIEVEVSNDSDNEVNATCRIDCGSWQVSLPVLVGPHATRTFSESVSFDTPGWIHGQARLESNLDVLPDDDWRPLVVRVRETPRVLLLTRQPELEALSSSWYLQQALEVALSTSDSATQAVTRLHPSQLSPSQWPEADLYVVDHPGLLDEETLNRLSARVRRGRGLLYVTAELADAMNLQRLEEALGSGFEPPVRFVASDNVSGRKDLFVSRIEKRQVPFRILGASVESAFRPVRFGGGLPTQTVAEALKDTVLAELSDSSTLLYVTRADAGQVAVLNADLGQSNWPVQSTFVPVIGELVQTLIAGASDPGAAACGEPLVRMLPTDLAENSALTAGPADDAMPTADSFGQWDWSAGQGALVWTWLEPAGPGVYQVKKGREVVFAVATAAPAIESDLQTLDEIVLKERMTGGRRVGYSDPTSDEPSADDIWNWLIVACLLGLIAEITALRLFKV